MADRTEATMRMSASASDVLEVIADLEAYPQWADGVKSVEVLERTGDDRPARARFDVSSGIVNGWYVVDYRWQSRSVEWSLVESPLMRTMEGSYDLVDDDEGCVATYRLELVPSIPLVGPLRRKAERQLVETALKDLRARAEGMTP